MMTDFKIVCLAAFFLFIDVKGFSTASFQPSERQQQSSAFTRRFQSNYRTQTCTILSMALTPVGPFCPFRSEAAMALNPKMEELNNAGPEFATDLARVQIEMQAGEAPDPERLKKVADGIDAAVDQWETLVARLRLSNDFQTREYGKLTQAHLESNDVTVESTAAMMRWQGACLRAIANNMPPPLPPPEVDIAKMMEQSQKAAEEGQGGPPSLAAMQSAQAITANPFDPSRLESPTVRDEYETLVRDHSTLIEFGANYDSFDPLGKLAYLDEIDKIEERWDVFFLRFKLMGVLNEDYRKQCDDFLASMSLTEDGYRQLLKKCHQLMREDAERERNAM